MGLAPRAMLPAFNSGVRQADIQRRSAYQGLFYKSLNE